MPADGPPWANVVSLHVEDHPVEYNKFEGTIPKGEYGGGSMIVWDQGRWVPEGDPPPDPPLPGLGLPNTNRTTFPAAASFSSRPTCE